MSNPQNWRWPDLTPTPLPHQSTMSRRQRTASVEALRDALYAYLRQVAPCGWMQEIDGRALTINGFSKDPDARFGYAGKSLANGYKFHAIWDSRLVPATWELHAMNRAEQKVAVRSLVAGIPARMVRTLTEQELRWKKDNMLLYQDLARRSAASMQLVDALTAPEPDLRRIDIPGSVPLSELKAANR